MEPFICRTCLKTNLANTNAVPISSKTEVDEMSLKDMLEVFMPEMDLDITEHAAIMCIACSELLKGAYMFKSILLRTEEMIWGYLHRNHINLGQKIVLKEILSHNEPNNSDSKDIQEISDDTDSYKSNLEFDEEVSDSGSDTDTEEAIKSPKTRKRKRANVTKKNKAGHNSSKRCYTCNLCEYKAYRLDLLESHKRKHDKNTVSIKEFKCDLCRYSTPRKRALERHLFTHQGKSQHSCKICHKTFAEKYQLTLHCLTHTGQELPHKCLECGKSYLTKSYLKQHMETKHLAKKKSFCLECVEDNCEHSFSRYYKCNMCESSFSDKRGLDAHKFTHTGGEFPFKCSHCSFGTAWKGNLKKHLRKKH